MQQLREEQCNPQMDGFETHLSNLKIAPSPVRRRQQLSLPTPPRPTPIRTTALRFRANLDSKGEMEISLHA